MGNLFIPILVTLVFLIMSLSELLCEDATCENRALFRLVNAVTIVSALITLYCFMRDSEEIVTRVESKKMKQYLVPKLAKFVVGDGFEIVPITSDDDAEERHMIEAVI